jgi:putative transposase
VNAIVVDSDRGSQYRSLVYTDGPAELGVAPSVGSRGDSYDDALAEAVNAAYKNELIHRGKPWRNVHDVELTSATWVAWCNQNRQRLAACTKPSATCTPRKPAKPGPRNPIGTKPGVVQSTGSALVTGLLSQI